MAEPRGRVRGTMRMEQPDADDWPTAYIWGVRGDVHERSSSGVQASSSVRVPFGWIHGELLRNIPALEVVQQPPHRSDQGSRNDDRRTELRGPLLPYRGGR